MPRAYRREKLSENRPDGREKIIPYCDTPAFRSHALRLVRERRAGYRRDTAAFTEIVKQLGGSAESLRVWYRQALCDAGERVGLASEECVESPLELDTDG